MIITEEHRQQARAEHAAKSRMSEVQKQRLRALSEDEARERADLVRFANAIHAIEPTLENLAKLITRSTVTHVQVRLDAHYRPHPRGLNAEEYLARRAWKLKHWLLRGYTMGNSGREGTAHEINSPSEILSLSELTAAEECMSEERFRREWPHAGLKPVASAVQPERFCALGRYCLRAERGRGRLLPAASRAQYCSRACSDRARIRRVASEDRINIGASGGELQPEGSKEPQPTPASFVTGRTA